MSNHGLRYAGCQRRFAAFNPVSVHLPGEANWVRQMEQKHKVSWFPLRILMTREICSHLGSLGFSFKISTVSETYTGDLLHGCTSFHSILFKSWHFYFSLNCISRNGLLSPPQAFLLDSFKMHRQAGLCCIFCTTVFHSCSLFSCKYTAKFTIY